LNALSVGAVAERSGALGPICGAGFLASSFGAIFFSPGAASAFAGAAAAAGGKAVFLASSAAAITRSSASDLASAGALVTTGLVGAKAGTAAAGCCGLTTGGTLGSAGLKELSATFHLTSMKNLEKFLHLSFESDIAYRSTIYFRLALLTDLFYKMQYRTVICCYSGRHFVVRHCIFLQWCFD
jgi:hypothetical protein